MKRVDRATLAVLRFGTISDQGYNLEDGTDCGLTGTGSLQNTDPRLDPQGLQNNGGPTQTIALQQGSPAIDHIPMAQCLTLDQRGASRPDDNESTCDIGAYESNYPEAPTGADLAITMVDAPDPVKVKTPLTYTITAKNNGPALATGVVVTDTLPSGVTFGSVTPSQGNCSGTTTVTCNLGSLTVNSQATITITVTPQSTGTLINSANIHGDQQDPVPSNDSAMTTTVVSTSGQPLRLTVSVQGQGKVTSSPAGINCGLGSTTCDATFPSGSQVTLTATPATTGGWKFNHWERSCEGSTSPTCTVTMNSDLQAKAVFTNK